MLFVFSQLNKDQLTELARLCFDLAKGAFAFSLLPLPDLPNSIIVVAKILLSFLFGIAFTSIGLLLLKRKEIVKK